MTNNGVGHIQFMSTTNYINYLLTSLFNLPGVYVEDLKEEELQQQSPQTSKRKRILEGPENYQTCMYFGDMIKTSGMCDEGNCVISNILKIGSDQPVQPG